MSFHREISRVAAGLLIAFFIVGLAAGYWAAAGPTSLLLRGDNPRTVLTDQNVQRGALLDRGGAILATSERRNGVFARVYTGPADESVLGRVEGGFGVSSIEAAYDTLLRGTENDALAAAARELVHQPRLGAEVQLTLAAGVQEALDNAFGGGTGAAIVIDTTTGEILGMVSVPRPEASEATPEAGAAVQAGANLALTGMYNAGGSLLPGLLSAALLDGLDITRVAYSADQCAVRLPANLELSLQDAFLYACSGPFDTAASGVASEALASTLSAFIVRPANGALGGILAGVTTERLTSVNQLQSASVTPLALALMAAGILEDGAAPSPQAALGFRPSGAQEWTPLISANPRLPVTTAATARRLQDLMRQAAAEGSAQNAGRAGLDIGGVAALAGTDDAPLSWFVGFTSLPSREGAAIAVVLDGIRDAGLAADIGGTALQAAAAAIAADG